MFGGPSPFRVVRLFGSVFPFTGRRLCFRLSIEPNSTILRFSPCRSKGPEFAFPPLISLLVFIPSVSRSTRASNFARLSSAISFTAVSANASGSSFDLAGMVTRIRVAVGAPARVASPLMTDGGSSSTVFDTDSTTVVDLAAGMKSGVRVELVGDGPLSSSVVTGGGVHADETGSLPREDASVDSFGYDSEGDCVVCEPAEPVCEAPFATVRSFSSEVIVTFRCVFSIFYIDPALGFQLCSRCHDTGRFTQCFVCHLSICLYDVDVDGNPVGTGCVDSAYVKEMGMLFMCPSCCLRKKKTFGVRCYFFLVFVAWY